MRLMVALVLVSLTIACAAGVGEALSTILAEPATCVAPVAALAQPQPGAPEISVAALPSAATCVAPMARFWPAETPCPNETTAPVVGSSTPRSPPTSD